MEPRTARRTFLVLSCISILAALAYHFAAPLPQRLAAAAEGEPDEPSEETPAPKDPAAGADEEKGSEELEWERPRFEERQAERLAMVKHQIATPYDGRKPVKAKRVLEAMRQVPRDRFVRKADLDDAYLDHPLPIDFGQTISQPYIVAFMTELIELQAGEKVLEIGTGSCYQAAVLTELTPHVYTIEIIQGLAAQAKKRFEQLGYKTIKTKQADGYYGWQEHAPFDAVIVTAAAGHVPPPLVAQLKPGGRMVIPVGDVFAPQHLVVVSRTKDGDVQSRSVLPVRFVPMRGAVERGQ